MIITSDASEYHKPQKELLQLIMNDLNVAKEKTMMVGDTEMDIELGQNGEVGKIVGVLSGSGNQQDLRKAHVVLGSVAEMIDKLEL